MTNSPANDFLDEIPLKDAGGNFTFVGRGDDQTVVGVPTDSHLAVADEIQKQLNLSFGNEILDRRFKNIILTALKEIRTLAQAQAALTQGQSAGGLGLNPALAQSVVELIRTRMNSQPSAPIKTPPLVKPLPTPAVKEYPPHKFSAKELDHELAPPPPVVIKAPAVSSLGRGLSSLVGDKRPAVQPTAAGAALNKKSEPAVSRHLDRRVKPFVSAPSKLAEKLPIGDWWRRVKGKIGSTAGHFKSSKSSLPTKGLEADNKPRPKIAVPTTGEKITDIKIPQHLVGPVEELQSFRLVDWRRLASDPLTAMAKIKEKIELLARESLAQKIAGIEAWKRSEVYRLYLLLGKESLEQGQSLATIVAQRQKQQQPFLSLAEFSALGKLNKMLEYY